MLFNEYAKKYDDHTKNIAFLMDKKGEWSLSPAYDITFSYKKSLWVKSYQMLINGKADNITRENLLVTANKVGIKKSEAENSIAQVLTAISKWDNFAEEAGFSIKNTEKIKSQLKK